ncbi:hypothetical protein BLLJ_1529 [Bifidobacterium longum subsp. longum JCM 1217]|nr:hypothetical protein HMPREF0177_00841 [Bifidobacterium longum]EPE38524.1 hypothetical protein I118_1708 [Bifidobacterium longum D2957]BAJ67196.1 hypothetical protein BLLJ_1529 [Bifidobacterium longum subsp. longum JCM 1217]
MLRLVLNSRPARGQPPEAYLKSTRSPLIAKAEKKRPAAHSLHGRFGLIVWGLVA